MSVGEGDRTSPGCYRRQTVRVGELVPTPASEVPNLMKELEIYMNEQSELPSLIQTSLSTNLSLPLPAYTGAHQLASPRSPDNGPQAQWLQWHRAGISSGHPHTRSTLPYGHRKR